jgi:hypothetical protein
MPTPVTPVILVVPTIPAWLDQVSREQPHIKIVTEAPTEASDCPVYTLSLTLALQGLARDNELPADWERVARKDLLTPDGVPAPTMGGPGVFWCSKRGWAVLSGPTGSPVSTRTPDGRIRVSVPLVGDWILIPDDAWNTLL